MRNKRQLKCLTALVMSTVMLVPVQAAYATEGQVEKSGVEAYEGGRAADADGFEIEDGVLKKYTGTATEVVIPEGVTEIGSFAFLDCDALINVTVPNHVTSINYYAFSGCSSLEEITVPESLIKIGEGAFWNCSSLKGINIPKGLTEIGGAAFSGCSSLREVSIPEGVTELRNATFRECDSLTEISIPKGVMGMGSGVFKGCSSLAAIKVEEGNAVYDSREDCNAVIETESNTLIVGCKNTIIPEGVVNIGPGAFSGCDGLMGLTIPEGIVSIGDEAFMGCSNLTEIIIPVGVTSINRAFSDCSSLATIKVEEGNTVYDSREDCNAIIETESNTLIAGCKNTIIPEGVAGIGHAAFSGCNGLMRINIPGGVTKIEYYAFSDCGSLTEIIIPEGVMSIRSTAFSGCSSLATIKVEEGNAVYDSREDCNAIIETESNTLIAGCKNTIIPEGIVSIGDEAFMGCSSLTEISIPEGVVSIGSTAFFGCSEGLTIYGKTGSYAEIYAKENNIKFSSTGVALHPIGKKTISSSNISLSQTSYTYDGTAKKPTVTVKDGSKTLIENIDYTVTYSNNINVGTAKVTVTGKGNYTGTVTKEFTIAEAPTSGQIAKELSKCTITISKASYAYDGKAKKPTVTVKDGSKKLIENTDYTVTYSNNINVGTAKVTVTGKGNYKGTVTKNFAITVKKGTSYKAGSFQYKVTGTSTVSMTGIKDNKITKVKVPKTVQIGGKPFKVTAIANNAFKNNKKITSVEIGDNVKSIGTSAFEGCAKLSKVVAGKGVTEIGGNSFKKCRKLGTITIKSNKLKKVGRNALKGIKATAKIKVPAKKLSAYKKLFKNKGQGRKVKIVK